MQKIFFLFLKTFQNKLQEDIATLKQQFDQYPQISHLDNELHNLRAQLADARIRLNSTTAPLLDSNRLAQLEQSLHDLQIASKRGKY